MEELPVTIIIADRPYKLLIDKDQEEVIRNAAKMIEKRIKDYSGSYAYKDKQDLVAMVALEFGTSLVQKEKANKETNEVTDQRLMEIEKALDNILQQPV